MSKFLLEIIVKLRDEATKSLADINTGMVGVGKAAAAAAAGGVAAVGAGLVNISNQASDARTVLQGLDNVDLTAVLDDAQLLARRYGVDVMDVVKGTRTLMEEFGITSAEATDIITAGFAKGLDSSGDFLDSVGEYSNLFADNGSSAEEMFAMMESGMAGGVLGTDKAADAFKEFGIRMRELPTLDKVINAGKPNEMIVSQFESILRELGFSQDQINAMRAGMESGAVTMADMFKQVIGPLGAMDDKVRQNIIGVQLFGTQFEDLGASALTAMTMAGDSVEQLGTIAATEASTIASLGEVPALIFDKFSLALLPLSDLILGVVNAVMAAEDPFAELFDQVVALIPGLEDFVGQGAAIMQSLEPLIEIVQDNLVPILVALSAVIGVALVAAFVAIAAPIAKIVVLTGLFMGALFAAFVAVQKFWQELTTRFPMAQMIATRAMEQLQITVDYAMEAIGEIVSVTLAGMQQFWNDHGDTIMKAAYDLFVFLSEQFEKGMQFINSIISVVLKLINGDWKGALDGLLQLAKDWLNGQIEFWQGVWSALGPILTDIAASIPGKLQEAWDTLGPILQDIAAAIPGKLQEAWNALWPILTDIGNAMINAFTAALNALGPILENIKNAIGQAFMDAIAALPGILTDLYNSVVDAFASVQQWLSGDSANLDASKSAKTAVNSMDDWLTGDNGLIKQSETAFKDLQRWLDTVVQDAAPIAESVVKSISDWWNDTSTGLIAYGKTAFEELQTWLTNLNLDGKQIAKSIVTTLSNFLTGPLGLIGGAVSSAFTGVTNWLNGRSESSTKVGESIVTSLGGRLSSPTNGLTTAATNAFAGLTTWLRSRVEDGSGAAGAIISSMATKLADGATGLIDAATRGFTALATWLTTQLVTVVALGPGGTAAGAEIVKGLQDRLESQSSMNPGLINAAITGFSALATWLTTQLVTVVALGPGGTAAGAEIVKAFKDRLESQSSMNPGLIMVTQAAFEGMRAYMAETVQSFLNNTAGGMGMNLNRSMVQGLNLNAGAVFNAIVAPFYAGQNAIRQQQGLPLLAVPTYTRPDLLPLPPLGPNPGTIPLPFTPRAGIVINIGSVRDQRDIDAIERAVTRGMDEAARRGTVQSQLPRGR